MRTRGRAATRHEDGSATVEFAMVLPLIVAMLGLMLASVAWGRTALLAQDAASTAARVAITNPDGEAESAARHIAGSDIEVHVSRDGDWITVSVTVPADGWLPSAHGAAVSRSQP